MSGLAYLYKQNNRLGLVFCYLKTVVIRQSVNSQIQQIYSERKNGTYNLPFLFWGEKTNSIRNLLREKKVGVMKEKKVRVMKKMGI